MKNQGQQKTSDQPTMSEQAKTHDQPNATAQPPSDVPKLKKVPPALRHGAFSKLNVLPGENVDEFLKLYRSLVAELAPDGPLEHNAVWSASRALVVNHWNELYKKSRLSRIRRIS